MITCKRLDFPDPVFPPTKACDGISDNANVTFVLSVCLQPISA